VPFATLEAQANPLWASNPNGEAAMDKEVVICLLGMLAKIAKTAIFPTSLP
jgi:hypothetical protein